MQQEKRAVLLLSGGIDSTTTLALIRSQGYLCYALSVFYGQRNQHELHCARYQAKTHGVVEHRVLEVNIAGWGGSALTDKRQTVPQHTSDHIPNTYVPARNTIFLSLALSWAEVIGAYDLFFGANQIDFSNYPDCRPAFIQAFAKAANLGTREGIEGRPFRIQAPLLEMTKKEIIQLGQNLGVDYATTISCYQPDQLGLACRQCDACWFRRKGFVEAGIEDITRYQSKEKVDIPRHC